MSGPSSEASTGSANTITVLLADDQALIRAGFRALIDSAPDLTVVGEAEDGASAIELLRSTRADVVLIAPSRCGKTPTSLYLALQHGVFAANYPLTDEDLESGQLPGPLKDQKHKLYGLIIDATRLAQIREERRPGSKYASIQQASYELRQATKLYKKFNVPYSDSTNMSVEEIATMVMQEKNLRRQRF